MVGELGLAGLSRSARRVVAVPGPRRSKENGTTDIAELTGQVAAEQSSDKAQARKVIETALKVAVEAAKDDAAITLPDFGKFKVQSRKDGRGCRPSDSRTRLPYF